MINQENLNKLYDAVINETELTTKELNSYGFNSKDLADLIDNKVLERTSWGHYAFVSVDSLYSYGKKLIKMKQYDKAYLCFEKCYQMNPEDVDICYQMFFQSINHEDYEKCFEYVDVLLASNKRTDINFYLWLLNMIVDIPERYRDYVMRLTWDDVKISDNPENIVNKIRTLSFRKKFKTALHQLNDMMSKMEVLGPREIMVKILLTGAINEKDDTDKNIYKFVANEDYDGLIAFFETKKYYLGRNYSFIKVLATKILDIKKTNCVPEVSVFLTDSFFEAIKGNNFQLAFDLMEKYNQENSIKTENNVMYILLTKINEEIKKIEHQNTDIKDDSVDKTAEEVEMQDISSSFIDVVSYLMKQDFDNSYICLKNYLNKINKSEYEFLLIDLIKLSCLENDVAFTKPMIVLSQLNGNIFDFNISSYVQDFYIAMGQNKYEEARVYLDIIVKSKNLVKSDILVEVLEQALDTLEGKKDNEVGSVLETKIENTNNEVEQEAVDEFISIENDSVMPRHEHTLVQNIDKKNVINKDYDDVSFINGKLDELYENGIVLLRPMDGERRKGIHKIVRDIPDVVSFDIGSDYERRIVLRYKPYIDYFVDLKQLISDGNQAYNEGNYIECIDNFRQVLEFKYPKAYVYARLGLAYMKTGKITLAIDYLTIATELSKKEDNQYDFTELIAKLSGKYNNCYIEKKPNVRMNVQEFIDDMYDYYEVPNMEEIFDLVESGAQIEEACQMYDLTDEDIRIVYLIFAKRCYAEERYRMGDQYFKLVEKSSDKTEFVKWLLNEVRINRNFYKNRVEVIQKKLTSN